MKKHIIYLSLATMFLFSGCEDFLDKTPDNRTEIDNPNKISSLLVNAYPDQSWAALCISRCDNIVDFGTAYGGLQQSSYFDFMSSGFYWRDEFMGGNDTYSNLWVSCYKAIASANIALQAIEESPERNKLALQKGEALLARAYSHFVLVSLYCKSYNSLTAATDPGVPYVDEVEDVVTKPYERKTVAYVYERIEKDLVEGLKTVGTEADYVSPKYHFTQTSAHAFATRFYLLKRDYGQVIAHANAIFPQPVDFDDITYTYGTQKNLVDPLPSEFDPAVIFASKNFHDWTSYKTLGSSKAIQQQFSNLDAHSNLLMTEQMTALPMAFNYYYVRYGMNDKVLKALVNNTPTTGMYVLLNTAYTSFSKLGFIPKFELHFQTTSINAEEGLPWCAFPLFRIEEVLLNRAEAYALIGADDAMAEKAIADLNIFARMRVIETKTKPYNEVKQILSKTKLEGYYKPALNNPEYFINKYNPETASWSLLRKSLLNCVLDFRNIEFIHEGMRWYDIIRWNMPVMHTTVENRSNVLYPGDDRILFQIPETATLSGIELNKRDNLLSPEW